MGCFNQVCCISGLPITEGDRVRYFLLTENPYEDTLICSNTDLYFPRTYPLSAVYNHYGSIEDYDPDCPQIVGLLEQFKRDLVPVGIGDNQCHDVATRKDMGFEKVLKAVWERRILVDRKFDPFKEDDSVRLLEQLDLLSLIDEKENAQLFSSVKATVDRLENKLSEKKSIELPDWLPTVERVSELLEKAGYTVNHSDQFHSGPKVVLVDEQAFGWVRIRPGGFGEGASLEPVVAVLNPHFSAMITAGTGTSAFAPEIQVMPQAGEEGSRSFLDRDSKKPLKVYQGMILEDVWQGIIHFDWRYKERRSELQKTWEEFKEKEERFAKFQDNIEEFEGEELVAAYQDEFSDTKLFPMSPLRDLLPFSMSVEQHHKYIRKSLEEKAYTAEQMSDYFDNVAGMVSIISVMYPLGYAWHPSFSFGPQDSPYDEHQDWHELLGAISAQLRKRHSCEEDEYDEDEDEV